MFLFPELTSDEIHIWQMNLNRPEYKLAVFHDVLSENERGRVCSYLRTESQHQYIRSRGMLRHLLGGYLEIDPKKVCLGQNPYGKPILKEEDSANQKIFFSLSHSGPWFVYAVTLDHEVGVDIEQTREDIPCCELSDRFFSDQEVRSSSSFFNLWTAHEALSKADGKGLKFKTVKPSDWFSLSLFPTRNYAGTVIAKNPYKKAKFFFGLRDFHTTFSTGSFL